jgi:hypothetical protein
MVATTGDVACKSSIENMVILSLVYTHFRCGFLYPLNKTIKGAFFCMRFILVVILPITFIDDGSLSFQNDF